MTYQEGANEGNETTVRSKTVSNRTHSVLTDTITNVRTGISAKTGTWWLEVDGALNTSQVTASQVRRATHEFGENRGGGGEDNLGELTRCLSSIGGFVDRKALLPASGELPGNAAGELGMFFGVLLCVGSEEGVPRRFGLRSASCGCCVDIVSLLWDVEGLVGGEAELRLQGGDVVSLESCWPQVRFEGMIREGKRNLRAPCTPWVPCSLEP